MRLESDRQWQARRLEIVPGPWRERVRRGFAARITPDDMRPGNEWLRDITERMEALRVPLGLTDAEICSKAMDCAADAMSLAAWPATTIAGLRDRLERLVIGYGIKPPERERISKRTGRVVGVSDEGAVRRMTGHLWWRRALRRSQARALEREAITLGYVHRRAEIYASDVTVERRGQQRKRNAETLEATEAINTDTGEIYTLAALAEKANSNPAIRRGELMVRIAGFEGIAQGLGHVADFWTITAPSKFHAVKSDGTTNVKFNNSTPRDTQRYLTGTWAKCRAALKRAGASVYGFRIAEPHHDGTPHWHCLFFVPPEQADAARGIIRAYFMAEDAGESGARDNRVKLVQIDWSKGTAAGYVAKYVSKNIDGFAVQGDFEGDGLSAVTGSQRVEAWAATWGIRQFQQIGGAPVGVWRELRRTDDAEGQSERFEAARAAADAGNWRRYVEVQGGPLVERRNLRLRCAYTRAGQRWNHREGDIMPGPSADGVWRNRYGEPAAPAVFGVRDVVDGVTWQSRRYSWEIGPRRTGAKPQPSEVRRGLGVGVPWTRVNNCTQDVFSTADADGYPLGFFGRDGNERRETGTRASAGIEVEDCCGDADAIGVIDPGGRAGMHQRDGGRHGGSCA